MKIDKRLLEPENKDKDTLEEREEWEKYGVNNRQQWRELLNANVWKEFTPDIKNDCYIGTHESNLTLYRRRREKELGLT